MNFFHLPKCNTCHSSQVVSTFSQGTLLEAYLKSSLDLSSGHLAVMGFWNILLLEEDRAWDTERMASRVQRRCSGQRSCGPLTKNTMVPRLQHTKGTLTPPPPRPHSCPGSSQNGRWNQTKCLRPLLQASVAHPPLSLSFERACLLFSPNRRGIQLHLSRQAGCPNLTSQSNITRTENRRDI